MPSVHALFGSSNYWGSPVKVGSHHLATGLVRRGWRVGYVSDPISPFHVMKPSSELRQRVQIWRSGGVDDLDGSLWAYVPGAIVVPDPRWPFRHPTVAARWAAASVPRLSRVLTKHGFSTVQLLCIDSLVLVPLAEMVESKCLVYRMADRASGFPDFTPAIARAEAALIARADLVACSSEGLVNHAQDLGASNAVLVQNGVDFDLFSTPTGAIPPEYKDLDGPIAVYAGTVDYWFDDSLIVAAAKALPEVTFVVIGPGGPDSSTLRVQRNVMVLGPRPHASLPSYLQHADVGLIPLRARDLQERLETARSLKLFEYLAAGLPVVATSWTEIERLGSPAVLTQGTGEFVEALESTLASSVDRAEMVDYARGFDWGDSVDLLIANVTKFLGEGES
ncbi:MAG: glycosyltransferase [Acidobacteria bacterium]|nr:MAG: glycosyltransferase [Acidobacteriota bacterium]